MLNTYGILPWVLTLIKQYPLHYLSQNPNAIGLLMEFPELRSSYYLSKNPNYEVVPMLLENPDTIIWQEAMKTSVGLLLLEHFPEKLEEPEYFRAMSINYNPIAVNILLKQPERTDPFLFSQNKNPKIFEFLEKNPSFLSKEGMLLNENSQTANWVKKHYPEWLEDPFNWKYMSRNSAFMEYLIQNPKRIMVPQLCQMKHLLAIKVIENIITNYMHQIKDVNYGKIEWTDLSANPFAIYLLEKNKEKICPYLLQTNPSIFGA
jgi:hypothetical protein